MAVYGNYGIFQGGELSVPIGSTSVIQLTSHKIRLSDGNMTGHGTAPGSDVAKIINVSFGNLSDNTIYERASTLVPTFYLNIGSNTTNTCWVYYDTGIDDMALLLGNTPPAVGTVIFGKITWANATSISSLVINTDQRTESYIGETLDVNSANGLYYDGQRWIGGAKNRPLVNMSLLAQVLESESRYILGNEYFITQCQKADIASKNLTVRLKGISSFARKPGNIFAVYATKSNIALAQSTGTVLSNGGSNNQIQDLAQLFSIKAEVGDDIVINHNSLLAPITTTITNITDTIITVAADLGLSLVGQIASYELSEADLALVTTFGSLVAVQGQIIYIQINKATGAPLISTSHNSSTHYIVATGSVTSIETDLANVDWRIVNNLGGLSKNLEDQARHLRSLHSSGFMNKVILEELNSDNRILLKSNILNVDGYFVPIPDTEINLTLAPVTGTRQDFVYIELRKSAAPWPILSYEVKVKTGVDFDTYVDPFSEPNSIENLYNNAYTYSEEGFYKAVDPDNDIDGYSYAIPLIIAHRYNQLGFNLGTQNNGGVNGTRIDGKRFDRISLKDVQINAPVVLKKDLSRVFDSSLVKLLSGELNTRLMPSNLDASIYSRYPLQVDRLGSSTVVAGTTHIGTPDGIRSYWGSNYSLEIPMFALIKEDTDSGTIPYDFPTVSYDDATKILQIKVPSGTPGEILRDDNNQPKDISIRWVATGLPVEFIGNWSTGQAVVSSNTIKSVSAPDYIAGGEIAVFFKIKYTDSVQLGLTKIPSRVIAASLNSPINTLAASFGVAFDTYERPTFVKNINGTATINSITYSNALYIKRLGDVNKFGTYEYRHYVAGNGNNSLDYQIPDSFSSSGTYALVGLMEVRNALTGESLIIDRVKWTYNTTANYLVRLGGVSAPSSTTPLIFIFAVAGDANKQIDLNLGSLAVASVSNSVIGSWTGSVTPSVAQPNRDVGIYRYSSGKVVYGTSSIKSGTVMKAVAWVGEDMVLCTVLGINSNLLTLDLSQSDISNYTGANWTSIGGGKYAPDGGVTIRIVSLQPFKLSSDSIYISYEYSALPFSPYLPSSGRFLNDALAQPNLVYPYGENAEIVARGYLFLSNDGIANDRGSFASPFSERFPAVQNVVIVGKDVTANALGWNDVISYQQLNKPFVAGQPIVFGDDLVLNVNVVPETGQIVYACIVKQLNLLRMFVYVVRNGGFIIDNPDQAFICELDQNYREVVR